MHGDEGGNKEMRFNLSKLYPTSFIIRHCALEPTLFCGT